MSASPLEVWAMERWSVNSTLKTNTPAFQALLEAAERLCRVGVVFTAGGGMYNYSAELDEWEMHIHQNDMEMLLHEIAHWVVGDRLAHNYGLGEAEGRQSARQEVMASVLTSYWSISAGFSAALASVDTTLREIKDDGEDYSKEDLQRDLRKYIAKVHRLLAKVPAGLNDAVMHALSLDGAGQGLRFVGEYQHLVTEAVRMMQHWPTKKHTTTGGTAKP